MIAISLQSGSSGNCIYVESHGVRLLLDAGISGKQAEQRLAAHGRDIRSVHAIILSHDHADHVRSAGIFQRKFKLPIYVTPATLAAARNWCDLGELHDVRLFRSGAVLEFGEVAVRTLPTPHDAADGVGFVVQAGGARLGVLTDLGHVFDSLAQAVATLDGVILESNYDEEMLEHGAYPYFLKQRIRGPHGHLSNAEAARLLLEQGRRRLRWAYLAHLSQENNTPELALSAHRHALGAAFPLRVASRYHASEVMEL